MNKRMTILALARRILLSLLTLAVLLPTAARAVDFRGAVTAIDIQRKTIEVELADGRHKVFRLAPDTKILRNAVTLPLNRLTVFDLAEVRQRASDKKVVRLSTIGPAARAVGGSLRDLAIGAGEVLIGGKLVLLTPATRVIRNGESSTLSSFGLDDRLTAHLRPGSDDALDLLASGPTADEVHGTISAVSASSIVIQPLNGSAFVTLTIVSSTTVEIDGATAAVSQLMAGQDVEAHYHPTTLEARAIEADAEDFADDAHVSGVITALDFVIGTISIGNASGAGAPITLSVTASTEVELAGDNDSFDQLVVGMPVAAEYDLSTRNAKEIHAGDASADDNDVDDDLTITGAISAVDATAGTVTMSSGGTVRVLQVVASTRIEINGEPGALAQILVGASAKAEYFRTSLELKELSIGQDDGGGPGGGGGAGEDVHVLGTVAAVDTSAGTLTVDPDGSGANVTVKVVGTTVIEINGEPGILAQVQVGATIDAEYFVGSLEAKELNVNQGTGGGGGGGGAGEDVRIEGTVTAVDTTAKTVTVDPTGAGADVTVHVVDATQIEINGEPGTLAQIPLGAAARVDYFVNSLEATEIKIGG